MNERVRIPIHEISHGHHEEKTEPKEYGKLAVVIAGIVVLSVLANIIFDGSGPYADMSMYQAWLAQFMGVFFIVFAGFKLVNINSFVHGFSMYDLIAAKSTAYARAYPFLQLILGIAMFVLPQFSLTHFCAAILSGIALAGVVNSLQRKQSVRCACLGNVIKMPLATVSGIEDGIMFVISIYMTIAMIG